MGKLLSGNWNSHDVGAMYHAIFAKPHPKTDFMDLLKLSLANQKYYFEPATDPAKPGSGMSIAHYIPDVESLFDELRAEMMQRHPVYQIHKQLSLQVIVGEHLREILHRFYQSPPNSEPGSPPDIGTVQDQFMRKLQSVATMIGEYLTTENEFGVREAQAYHIEALK